MTRLERPDGLVPRPPLPSLLASLVVALLLLAACSSSDGGNADAGPVTVDELLTSSAAAMSEIDSAHFSIEHGGAEVFIDDEGLIGFVEASGRYAAPSSADALVGVTALGIDTEIGAVAIDGEVWITNPLTSKWEPAPAAFTFDPAQLFDPDVGLGHLLLTGLTDTELVSDEVDDDGRYHLRAAVDGDQVSQLTGGLVDDVSNVDVWIDGSTSLIAEVTFDVETGGGDTSWRLLVSDYGADVTITEPDLG